MNLAVFLFFLTITAILVDGVLSALIAQKLGIVFPSRRATIIYKVYAGLSGAAVVGLGLATALFMF